MNPLGFAHELDLFFRDEGGIVAGISLLRSESLGNFTDEETTTLKKVHSFIEYTVSQFYLPSIYSGEEPVAQRFKLTVRQVDVIRMLRNGASNDEIARQMSISLATVKTHLRRIFARVAVSSRTELLSKLYLSGGTG